MAAPFRLLPALLFWTLAARAERVDFNVPVSHSNVIAVGMGDAYTADGTGFNAVSYNPALLPRAPKDFELLGIGASLSHDLLPTVQFLKDNRTQIRDTFKNLKQGFDNADTAQISRGLDSIQTVVDKVADKPFGATAGPYASARINGNFGLHLYNSSNFLLEASQGALTESALAIPRPINLGDAATVSAINNLIGTLSASIQRGIDEVVTSAQQTQIQGEINALLNGTQDTDAFLAHVSTTLASIDLDALKQAIVNNIQDDVATTLIVGYSDTVLAGSYAFGPLPDDVPNLTMGVNLKAVNRRITIQALAPQDMKGNEIQKRVGSELKLSTTRFGMDAGLHYYHEPWRLGFGVSFQDVIRNRVTVNSGPDTILNQFTTDPGPLVMRAGLSWRPLRRLRLNVDGDDMLGRTLFYEDEPWTARLKGGGQLEVLRGFFLRGGAGNRNYTAGAGLVLGAFGMDYAYAVDPISQRFSHFGQVRVAFGGKSPGEAEKPLWEAAPTAFPVRRRVEAAPEPKPERPLKKPLSDYDVPGRPKTLPKKGETPKPREPGPAFLEVKPTY